LDNCSYAVKQQWNSDSYFVDFRVDEEIKIWIGPAACQQTGPKCVLRGGKLQIWIDDNTLEKLNLKFNSIIWSLDTTG